MEQLPTSSQHGFSLIEVLAVLIISSTLLVSMNTLVMMSQRSFIEFSDASAARSQEFFFEQQFAAFIDALEQDSHPDIDDSCRLSGTETEFSGCFYNIFHEDRPIQLFQLAIANTDDASILRIEFEDNTIDWTRSDQPISISYLHDDGTRGAEWPPEPSSQTSVGGDRSLSPRAIVLEFGNPDVEGWERRVFATADK